MRQKISRLWLTLSEIALVPLNADSKEKENNGLVTEQNNKIINNIDKVNDCLVVSALKLTKGNGTRVCNGIMEQSSN